MENKKLDLIDRKALIEKREEMWQDRCDHMVVRVTNIENMPTIDAVKVVHGRWLQVYHDAKLIGGKCSVCGKFEKLSSMRMLYNQYKFCHNCGAKMDGDGNA